MRSPLRAEAAKVNLSPWKDDFFFPKKNTSSTNLPQALPPGLLECEDGFAGRVAQSDDGLDEVALLLAQRREQVGRRIRLGFAGRQWPRRGQAGVGAEGLQNQTGPRVGQPGWGHLRGTHERWPSGEPPACPQASMVEAGGREHCSSTSHRVSSC